MRAAIYTRISLDRSGHAAGVGRQEADCRALCERRGWKVVDVYCDNDRSAYSGRERPAYERLLADVADGLVDVVVAWHSDRLWRNVLDQQSFLVLGRRSGLQLVATPHTDFDPHDADDSFMQTLLAAVAQKESADKARRMARRQQDKAAKGEFHGGRRAFGHTKNRRRVVAAEAKAVRDAATRLLRGEAVSSIVNDWNARGIRTTAGGPWRVDALSSLLVQPRLAGLRTHKGEVVAEATWPAILDRETHERLVALAAVRRTGPRPPSTRKYLLTGFLRCYRCRGRLHGTHAYGRELERYICPAPALGGCSGVTVRVKHAEAAVLDIICERVQSPEFTRRVEQLARTAAEAGGKEGALVEQVTKGRARLAELEEMFAAGEVDRDEYRRLRDKAGGRVQDAQERLARLAAVHPQLHVAEFQGDELRAAWDHMTLDEQRTIIGALVDHITVEPAVHPRNVFRRERLRPSWRV